MSTSRKLATKVIEVFKQNTQQSRRIRDVLIEILRAEGLGRNLAVLEAERLSANVLDVLSQMRPQELPFDFGSRDSTLLVGKGRIKLGDTEESVRARKVFRYVDEVWNAILNEDHCTFECLCAICLKLSGAEEAYASCSSDDGGIDFFGRITIGKSIKTIDSTLLETNILSGKRILFLGQAKRYDKKEKIGRPHLTNFRQSVNDCLCKYKDNELPPRHGVPQTYYRENELCLPIFMTTSGFTDKAEAVALSYDLIIVMGREISEFLCSRNVGFVREGNDYRFDRKLFHEWLAKESDSVKRKY